MVAAMAVCVAAAVGWAGWSWRFKGAGVRCFRATFHRGRGPAARNLGETVPSARPGLRQKKQQLRLRLPSCHPRRTTIRPIGNRSRLLPDGANAFRPLRASTDAAHCGPTELNQPGPAAAAARPSRGSLRSPCCTRAALVRSWHLLDRAHRALIRCHTACVRQHGGAACEAGKAGGGCRKR
jgi:hypothetical protein